MAETPAAPNRDTMPKAAPTPAASNPVQLLQSLHACTKPLTLAEMLALHPGVSRYPEQAADRFVEGVGRQGEVADEPARGGEATNVPDFADQNQYPTSFWCRTARIVTVSESMW